MKNLGFSKLSQIKPSDEPLQALSNEDAIAEKHGFVSREPVVRVEKVRKKNQIQDTLYVRRPIDMTNRFKILQRPGLFLRGGARGAEAANRHLTLTAKAEAPCQAHRGG